MAAAACSGCGVTTVRAGDVGKEHRKWFGYPHYDSEHCGVFLAGGKPMEMPQHAWRVVTQMHERFAGNYPPTEDGARAWTRTVVEQLLHDFPDGGWTCKASGPAAPQSKDNIARITDEGFHGWDVLIGAGANGPRVLSGYPPAFWSLTGQHPLPVQARNHLGTVGGGQAPGGGGGGQAPGGGGGTIPVDDALTAIATAADDVAAALTVMANLAAAIEQRGVRITITIEPRG